MGVLRGFYGSLITAGQFIQDFLLLAIRLFWGWSFFQHGLAKLQGIEQTAIYFKQLGIPSPEMSAHLVGGIECVGGGLLMLGLGSRLVALPLMIVMIVAYFTAHSESVRALFSNPSLAVQQPAFFFLLASFTVFVFGPGRISLDGLLDRTYFKSGKV